MKAPKYRNVPVEWSGERFDSKAELARYRELMIMQQSGAINNLTRQVSFVLAPAVKIAGKTKRALTYRADFAYTDTATGEKVIEDKKGVLTQAYIIKRHLMKHIHGIEIREV